LIIVDRDKKVTLSHPLSFKKIIPSTWRGSQLYNSLYIPNYFCLEHIHYQS